MYGNDGTDVTSFGFVRVGGAGWTRLSTGTGDFEIPAYSSRIFVVDAPAANKFIAGYAKVEWKSDEAKLRKALIGVVRNYRRYNSCISESVRLINHGDPF